MDEIRTARKTFSGIGLAYFLFSLTAMLVQLVMSLAMRLLGYSGAGLDTGLQLILFSMLPMYGVGLPVCILVMGRLPKVEMPGQEKWGPGKLIVCFIICLSAMYAGNIIGQILMNAVNLCLDTPIENNVINMVMDSNIWINILGVAIVGPFIEEFMFRKLLIDRICQYGQKTAVVMSGVAFGLVHGNLYQFFYACGLGMIFAYVYVKTGKLRYTVIMHMIINFMGSVVSMLLLRGIDLEKMEQMQTLDSAAAIEFLTDYLPQLMIMGLYGLLLMALTLAGVILFICFRKRITFETGVITIPKRRRFSVVFLNLGMILFVGICVVTFFMV